MNDLDQALADISEIRSHLARSAIFRGYGPATLAATGLLAFAAGGFQVYRIGSDPRRDLGEYLAIWIGAATLSALLVGAEMITRTRRTHGALAQEMLRTAVEHFLPAGIAGACLTVVLVSVAPETAWMLPGLWQMIVGLGVFASLRFLPPAIFWVGAWYLSAGLVSLIIFRGELALSPLAMAIPFGVGQCLSAAIVHSTTGAVDAA